MAQTEGTKEYNTFVKGLITEANPLSFPDNASIDESNFELLRTGQRIRRSGLDWEGATPGVVYDISDSNSWIQQSFPISQLEYDTSSSIQVAWSEELGLFVHPSGQHIIYTSNGETFENTDLGSGYTGRGIAWSPSLEMFAATFNAPAASTYQILTSTDGINWTISLSTSNSLRYVAWSESIGKFVVSSDVSDAFAPSVTGFYESSDGINWSLNSVGGDVRINDLKALGNLFVGTGNIYGGTQFDFDARFLISSDGENWTVVSPPDGEQMVLGASAYSPIHERYLAVSQTDHADASFRFLISLDGTSWSGYTPNMGDEGTFHSVQWVDNVNAFVAIGREPTQSDANFVMISSDGVTWDSSFPVFGPFDSTTFIFYSVYGEGAERLVHVGSNGGDLYRIYTEAEPTQNTEEVFDTATEALKTAIWTTDGTSGELDILVVQVGTTLSFFDANATNIMATPLNGGVSIDIGGDPSVEIEVANIFGKLVVVNNQKGFAYLSYDADSDTVSIEARIVLVRDIWGVADDIAINRRFLRAEITHTREYNLVNQGWAVIETQELPIKLGYMWIAFFHPFYPSNADLVSLTRDLTNNIDPSLLLRSQPGTTPAPKGFFILDAFRRGDSRSRVKKNVLNTKTTDVSGDLFRLSKYIGKISGWRQDLTFFDEWNFNRDESKGGLRAVASFAGRVWFSGAAAGVIDGDDNSPNLSSYVFFSQIVDSEDNISKCYQNGDPTSESSPDIVDTDGGAVKIPGMQNVFKMIDTGRSLVVFAENGIWEISGGETNFTATSFEINKVSNTTAISRNSVVEVEGSIFFWAEEGIYVLSPDQISQNLAAQNITQSTIQTFYDDIPAQVKKSVRGAFDPVSRKVRWLYSEDSDVADQGNITLFDSELILDLVLNAFYKFNIASTSLSFLADYVITNTVIDNEIDEIVEDSNGNTVEDSNNDDVIITRSLRVTGNTSTKFIAADSLGHYGIALYKDPLFEDFGEDAEAYLLTGYETLEDTMRDKQAPYITAHFEATENFIDANNKEDESSCLLQTQWDFANDASSEKFGPQQQIYRYPKHFLDAVAAGTTTEYGKLVLSSKTKMRGRGRALSLLFKTEPQKDLRIYGWGVKYTGVTGV